MLESPLVFKPIKFEYEENNRNGYQAFQSYDGAGVLLPTYEPELAYKAYIGKSNLSFHTSIWKQGIEEGTLFVYELKESFPFVPDFVYDELDIVKRYI